MKGYISRYEKAQKKALSLGYHIDAFGFNNVVKQIFAKMVVGGKTIGKKDGKFYTY